MLEVRALLKIFDGYFLKAQTVRLTSWMYGLLKIQLLKLSNGNTE